MSLLRSLIDLHGWFYNDASPTDFAAFVLVARQKFKRSLPRSSTQNRLWPGLCWGAQPPPAVGFDAPVEPLSARYFQRGRWKPHARARALPPFVHRKLPSAGSWPPATLKITQPFIAGTRDPAFSKVPSGTIEPFCRPSRDFFILLTPAPAMNGWAIFAPVPSAVRRGIFVESQTVLPGLLRRWRRPSAGGGCGLFNVYGHLMILQGIWTRREVIYRVRGVIYRLLEGV